MASIFDAIGLDGTGRAERLARLIAERELTSVEVVEASQRAIASSGSTLNAIVTTDDAALAAAKLIDDAEHRGGRLFGLPFSVKDTLQTRGVRTTAGAASVPRSCPRHRRGSGWDLSFGSGGADGQVELSADGGRLRHDERLVRRAR